MEITCPNPGCSAPLDVYANTAVGVIVCPHCRTSFTADAHHFCPRCGSKLGSIVAGGRERPACADCGYVLFYNPSPGVAVVVVQDGKVLLARRRNSVFNGMWCIPCGYLEADEDVWQAAQREFQEETGLIVELEDVYAVHSNFQVPGRPVVGIWFRGRVVGGQLCPGDDAAEVGFFPLDALPESLAFDSDRLVLARLAKELMGDVYREGSVPRLEW